jgi:RHS repeat-associated protein
MNELRAITGRTFTHSDEDHTLTAGPISYEFDYDDNLRVRTEGAETTQYLYSSTGELQRVTLPDDTLIEYINDPLGRRIAKKVNGAIEERYLWLDQTTLLAVYDGSRNLSQRFEYADDRVPYAMTQGGTTYYFAYDQVGSLRLITDNAGNSIKRVDYDSFGNIISGSNPSFAIPFGFAGGLHDPDTKLVRFGYRDYMPEIGKWTAKDPILFAGGDSNLYGYVQNDPVNFVDPEGLWIAQAIGGGVGAAYGMYSAHQNGTSMLQGALVGGLTGVLSTIPIPGLNGLASGALMGALSGGVGNLAGQATTQGVLHCT